MTNTPKPQANTLDEISVTMILDDGNETQVIDVETVQALITEARIDELENIEHNKRMFHKGIHVVAVSAIEDRLTQLKENK